MPQEATLNGASRRSGRARRAAVRGSRAFFLGIDAAVPPGYDNLSYVVRIKGNGTREQFAEIHKIVMATSPNFYNVSRPVDLNPTLVVE
jgi:hypothetical protein